MRIGDAGRMIIAITYMFMLCVLLVAGIQAIPSRQPLDLEQLRSQPRLGDSYAPADTAADEESLP